MARDYSSIYNLKDYASKELAPKYFNMDEVNDLNVGLLGFITEMLSTIAEDGFNTTTTYLNEIFPNKAVLPETIYNDAAMFQEDDIFATPAEMMAWLFVSEKDIISNGTIVPSSSGHKEFFIDSDLIINIEGIQFMLDYDIRISYVSPDNSTILYTAAYDRTRYGAKYKSALDADNSYYIKSRVITYNNEKYLAMYVKVHQVTRYSMNEIIITNDVINAPYFKIPFSGNISSFEVFCKEPDETGYYQLSKKLLGSAPEKGARFCYYRLSDDNELEVTFSMKDGYYKPSFGSEIIIDYTTTLGKEGEFELYTGSDIVCVGKSEKYRYNDRLIIFCITQSPSQFAEDKMSLHELQMRNVENFSTVKSYTTENDLDLYFSRFTTDDNVKMYTIKKRNDYRDRVFSSYALYRGSDGNIIKTNTANIMIEATSESNSYDLFTPLGDSLRYIPAGTIITAVPENTSNPRAYFSQYSVNDYITSPGSLNRYPFVYATPFAIYMTQNPTLIGYYLNNINETYSMDYDYIDTTAFTQFICNSFKLQRNSITGNIDERKTYHVEVVISPTTTINTTNINIAGTGEPAKFVNEVSIVYGDNDYIKLGNFDIDTGEIIGSVSDEFKVLMRFNNETLGPYVELNITHFDSSMKTFTLTSRIKTDDYITERQFRVLGLKNENGTTVNRMVDMYNCVVTISTYMRGRVTNRYISMGSHITFIKPLLMCSSDVAFTRAGIIDEVSKPGIEKFVDTTIYSVPLVSASTLAADESRDEFYKYYIKQYNYIEDILDNTTNNFNIDLKFYNTYGPSRNFHVEDDDELTENTPLIDSVNIKIGFRIKLIHGADPDILTRDIQYFVKNYVENINMDSSNSIYISNLIKELENEFDLIKYIKFDGISAIQKYPLQTQAIENSAIDVSTMNYVERRNFVPEYLTIDVDDVEIRLL